MEKTINLGSNRLLPAENHPKSTAQKLRRRLEIQFEWKNISSAYFVNLSNSEDAWLELILKLLLELDHSKDTKENIKERQDIFRRLSILCGRPQFVFGSFHKKKGIGKKYKSFRKRMGKLCDDFDEYIAINNVFNCYKKADEYLKRDSMPPLNALVDENSISTIQTKIIECFQKYRGEIATLFPKKGKKSEDENKNNSDYTPDMRFLKTVITNPKLITMAGTLFVRDMQYFMMRKSNHYKKYLSPSGMDFKLTRTYPRWVQRQEAFATRKCAKKIREILQEVIQKRTPNINMELSQSIEETIFRKDLSSEEKNSISRLYVWYQIFGTLSRDIVEGKNVPYPGIGCKTTTLAYMTALEFNLNHDQTEWLVQYMPNIIWGKNSVEKIFQKTTKTEFQNSEQIIRYLNINRQFLNPKNLFFNTDHEKFLEQVKKYIDGRKNIRLEQSPPKKYCAEDFFKELGEYYFHVDLMDFSLLFSKALTYSYGMDDFLPDFLSDRSKELNNVLKKYYSDEQTARFLNIKELSKRQQDFLRNDPRILNLKSKIQEQIQWEYARQFLNDNIIQEKGRLEEMEEKWGEFYPFSSLPQKQKEAAYFVAFQETTKYSMHLLEEQVIKQLITLTPSLVY